MTPDSDLRDQLRPLAERAMARGYTTGLQIAVVTRDGRLWSDAFGLADAETGRPVTRTTRFYDASTAKAILALTAARLDHQGRFDLDRSLAEAFPPGTRFHPDYDATTATVRDLLTHTHGIQMGPASFLIAYTGQYTNQQILDMLPMHPPLPNRDFNYTNWGYDLAGLLMAPDTKRGWVPLEQTYVLDPVGMTHTTNSVSELAPTEIAMPHIIQPGGVARTRLGKTDANQGAAGGQFTTAEDLARLVLLELNHGRLGGEQVIPEAVVDETQRQQAAQDRDIFFYHRFGWGLGWDLGTYDGDTVIHRPGSYSGYYSNAAFMPDHGFGLAVLSNGGYGGMYTSEILACAIYDIMTGKDRDAAVSRMDQRLDELGDRLAARQQAMDDAAARRELLDRPLRPLDEYVGTYTNSLMGTVQIARTAEGLEFRMGALQGALVPEPAMEGGSIEPFFAQLLDADDEVRFRIGDDGEIEALSVRGTPLVFNRVH